METYNNFIKEFIPSFFNFMLDKIHVEPTIYVLRESLKCEIEETHEDLSSILEKKGSAYFDFKFSYTSCIDEDEDEYEDYECIVRVPKMINGVFVLNGKYRLPVINLTSNNDLRNITETFLIFDYNRKYEVANNTIYVSKYYYDSDEEEDFSFVATEENLEKFKDDCLQLTEFQQKKAWVKYDVKTKYINGELIQAMRLKGSDLKLDNILDKQFNTVESGLRSHLNKSKWGIIRATMYKFLGKGGARRKGYVYPASLQRAIDTYFSMRDLNTFSSLQAPTTINPLNFQGLTNKVKISTSVSFNESFADFIDIVDTPINTNVNAINEMNVSVSILGDMPHIRIYDKDFNPVVLSHVDYLGCKVLINSQVDWKAKKVIESPKYRIKYKGRVVEDTEFDYIDCPPDEKLSATTRRIPMVNNSDSIRGAMGATMFKQAVELANGEAPLVRTPTEEVDCWNNPLSIKSSVEGTVVDVSSDVVTIEDGEGTRHNISIPRSLSSIHDISTNYVPTVKVGETITKGRVVTAPKSISEGTHNIGINAYTAFMPFWGLNSDDSCAVSESFAEKMGHYAIIDVSFDIFSKDIIHEIIKAGAQIKSTDSLIKCSREVKLNTRVETLSKTLLSDDTLRTENADKKAPNNLGKAWVLDVLVFKGDMDNYNYDENDSYIEEEYPHPSVGRKELVNIIPEYILNQRLEEDSQDYEERADFCWRIKFKIVQLCTLNTGAKLTNRYGSKSTIAEVVPDKLMPRDTKGRVIDLVTSAESPFSRRNMSQEYETSMSKIAVSMFNEMCSLSTEDEKVAFVDKYNKVYDTTYTIDGFREVFQKEGKKIFGFIIGSFANVTPAWMKEKLALAGVEQYEKLIEGRYNRPLDNPVNVGEMYILKLYHSPEHACKVTTTMPKPKSGSPRMSMGLYRSEGQKLGEQETVAMVVNAPKMLELLKKKSTESSKILLNHMYLVGIGVTDDAGNVLGSKTAELTSKLMDKYTK